MSLEPLGVQNVPARRPQLHHQASARSSAADEAYNSNPESVEYADEDWSIVSSEPITVVRWAPVSGSSLGIATSDRAKANSSSPRSGPSGTVAGTGAGAAATAAAASGPASATSRSRSASHSYSHADTGVAADADADAASGAQEREREPLLGHKTSSKPSIRPIKPAVDAARSFPLLVLPSRKRDDREEMRETSRKMKDVEEKDKEKKEKKKDDSSSGDGDSRQSVIKEFDRGPATPGVDDTPYIRFAIDQLTRDEEVKAKQNPTARFSQDSYPVNRVVPDEGLNYLQELRKKRMSAAGETPRIDEEQPRTPRTPRTPRSANPKTKSMDSDIFLPVDEPLNALRYPDLTFVPTILRPLSMISLTILCLLMIAGIMFSAIYALSYGSLLAFDDHLYGAEYFVFEFLPQILAAVLMIYVHGVMAALIRITPFMTMATGNTDQRSRAMFIRLHAPGFLLPEWQFFKCGRPLLGVCMVFLWLVIFTIPLQSCLFSVVRIDAQWRWTIVQSIAWALVGIYGLITIALVITTIYLFKRPTGLMWDPSSLADIIALLPRSNSLREFAGTEIAYDNEDIREQLGLSSIRLGYWRTPVRTQGVFYCLGEEGTPRRRYTGDGRREKEQAKQSPRPPSTESDPEETFAAQVSSAKIRFRYLPWFLRDSWVILWAVTGFILLVALLVVSFLPSTNILDGFPPLVSTIADSWGFAPASFLYSFLPSSLGLLLYLGFQYLDLALRRLQPWDSLAAPGGATAEASLLLEYTSCSLPMACGVRAVSRSHWRVAIFSTLSFVFILLPVLSGGLFFSFTTLPSGKLLMLPDAVAFYVLIGVLVLYFAGLLHLLPRRRRLHLPHDVNSLAGTISFLYASDFLRDPPFRAPRSKLDLIDRLESALGKDGMPLRYAFGVFIGLNNSEHLGVSRLDSIGRIGEV